MTPQTEHKCRADAPLPHSWGSYDPKLFVLASIRQEDLLPLVRLERDAAGRNEPVPFTAELTVPDGRFRNISVSARVSKGNFVQNITMYDDGAHGDDAADGGLYGASFNAAGATLAAGNYLIEVSMTSNSSAVPVLLEDPVAPGIPSQGLAPPTLTTTVETNLVLRDCRKTREPRWS